VENKDFSNANGSFLQRVLAESHHHAFFFARGGGEGARQTDRLNSNERIHHFSNLLIGVSEVVT
jgi:hypothetical protein